MQRAVDEAEAALIAAQPSSPVEKKVFRRGDRIVSLAIDKAPDHKGRMVESQVIVEVGEHALAERLGIAATFQKFDARMKGGGGLKRVDPPKDVVKTLIERGYSLKLPILVGVVNCPQLVVDGRILDKPGYDARTGIFLRSARSEVSGRSRKSNAGRRRRRRRTDCCGSSTPSISRAKRIERWRCRSS